MCGSTKRATSITNNSELLWQNGRHRLVLSFAAGGRLLSWQVAGRGECVKPSGDHDGGLLRMLVAPERYPGSSFTTPHAAGPVRNDERGFAVTLRYFWNTPALVAGLLDWTGKRNPTCLDGLMLEKTVRFDAAESALSVTLRIHNLGTGVKRFSPWLHNAFYYWVDSAFVALDGEAAPYRWDSLFWTGHRAEPGRAMRLVCANPDRTFFAVLGASADWLDGMAVYTKADLGPRSTEGSMELRGAPLALAPGQAWEGTAFLALAEGPESWKRWALESPLPLTSGLLPAAEAVRPEEAVRPLLREWALPDERAAGLMILSRLDKVPFSAACRTTANRAFAPFFKKGTTAAASVWLHALRDLDGLRAEIEAPPGWKTNALPARLREGALAELTLTGPATLAGKAAVRVAVKTDSGEWALTVPADAGVEKRHPWQVRQTSAYLEERFQRDRDVFAGRSAAGFRRWQKERKQALRAWLRHFVGRPVKLESRITERQEGPFCIREKVLIRVEPDMWMPCYQVRPRRPAPGRRLPAILFCCGSGPGKSGMAPDEAEQAQDPAGWTEWPSPYTLANQLQAVVLIPDRRGWGEWAEGNHNQRPQRALAAGFSMPAFEVWDHLKAVDYLAARADVDPGRIVCMGSSGGGWMTQWLTALHDRVAGGIVSSAMTLVAAAPEGFFYTQAEGSLPALSPPAGVPLCSAAVTSLAAPKPIWVMDGLMDGIPDPHLPESEKQAALARFRSSQDQGRAAIRRVYEILDAPDRCRISWFDGGHLAGFHFNNIREWLGAYWNTPA